MLHLIFQPVTSCYPLFTLRGICLKAHVLPVRAAKGAAKGQSCGLADGFLTKGRHIRRRCPWERQRCNALIRSGWLNFSVHVFFRHRSRCCLWSFPCPTPSPGTLSTHTCVLLVAVAKPCGVGVMLYAVDRLKANAINYVRFWFNSNLHLSSTAVLL